MKTITFTHPLQTKDWAEFRRKWGNEVVVLENKWVLTLHKLPLTPYKIAMFIKGPMSTSEMIKKLKSFSKENKVVFVKLEPNYVVRKGGIKCADKEKVIKLLRANAAIPGKTLFTPTTFWIDLTKTEDELLKSFHPKTRYNIRLAEKRGVGVSIDDSDGAFNAYIRLARETVKRDKFFAHNEKYHRLMWETLKDKMAHLLVARYNAEIVAAWILFIHDGVLYYPYGASTHKYKNLMASNLMMWEAIKFGKQKNLKIFDLWGREPGKGFTKFKEGYNPQVVEFLGTWDLVINKPVYYLYRSAETLRWLILRMQAQLGLTKYRF